MRRRPPSRGFGNDPDGGVWVPERVWDRIRLIGQAYGLHLLPLLLGEPSGGDSVTLNRAQVETLRDELEFVEARVNDDLVTSQTRAVIEFITAELSSRSAAVAITVE